MFTLIGGRDPASPDLVIRFHSFAEALEWGAMFLPEGDPNYGWGIMNNRTGQWCPKTDYRLN